MVAPTSIGKSNFGRHLGDVLTYSLGPYEVIVYCLAPKAILLHQRCSDNLTMSLSSAITDSSL